MHRMRAIPRLNGALTRLPLGVGGLGTRAGPAPLREMSSKQQQRQSFIDKAAQSGGKSLLGEFHAFGGRFDDCVQGVSVDRMDAGDVQVSFTVAESHANGYGTLHGGFIATLVDVVGTLALISQEQDKAGVSVDLNVTYMAAANIGDRVLCKGKLLRIGKSLGFTQVDLYRESDGKLLATGRHTKAFPPKAKAKPAPTSQV